MDDEHQQTGETTSTSSVARIIGTIFLAMSPVLLLLMSALGASRLSLMIMGSFAFFFVVRSAVIFANRRHELQNARRPPDPP